jgi:hypothetical protein
VNWRICYHREFSSREGESCKCEDYSGSKASWSKCGLHMRLMLEIQIRWSELSRWCVGEWVMRDREELYCGGGYYVPEYRVWKRILAVLVDNVVRQGDQLKKWKFRSTVMICNNLDKWILRTLDIAGRYVREDIVGIVESGTNNWRGNWFGCFNAEKLTTSTEWTNIVIGVITDV